MYVYLLCPGTSFVVGNGRTGIKFRFSNAGHITEGKCEAGHSDARPNLSQCSQCLCTSVQWQVFSRPISKELVIIVIGNRVIILRDLRTVIGNRLITIWDGRARECDN